MGMAKNPGKKEKNQRKRPEPLQRVRSLLRHNKRIRAAVIVTAAALLALAGWMIYQAREQDSFSLTSEGSVNMGSGYRNITWQGKSYHYNNRVTAILFAGLDSDEEIRAYKTYASAPQADSIALMILDERKGALSVLSLSRDTMTPIHRYTLNGRDRGLFTDHLGYAYTYGDGGAASCRNLCEAVSSLLCGIPVNLYVTINRSSLSGIAQVLGPISMTVPNDSLADLGIHAGDMLTVDENNIETFLRSRDTAQDFSNVPRMERQRAYTSSAMARIQSLLGEKPTDVWDMMEGMNKSVLTNIKRNRYLELARIIRGLRYSDSAYLTLEGRNVTTETYDEFYPDPEALTQRVIDLFYLPD